MVLGHPEYYPRFGFVPASRHGLAWEHPAPDEAFMVLPLREGAIAAGAASCATRRNSGRSERRMPGAR